MVVTEGTVVEWLAGAVVAAPVVVGAGVVVGASVVVGAIVVVLATVVPPAAVVGATALAVMLTVDPRSTSTVPLASDGSTCNMTAPERYLITSRAWATSPGR